MKAVFFTWLVLIASLMLAHADKPVTENREWEPACGGSNIALTRVGARIVAVEASAEHFAEARQWQCHFKDGEIFSAMYRHFLVTRKSVGDGGEFTTVLNEDRIEVFHFPDHQIGEMDPILKKDLMELLAIAPKN